MVRISSRQVVGTQVSLPLVFPIIHSPLVIDSLKLSVLYSTLWSCKLVIRSNQSVLVDVLKHLVVITWRHWNLSRADISF